MRLLTNFQQIPVFSPFAGMLSTYLFGLVAGANDRQVDRVPGAPEINCCRYFAIIPTPDRGFRDLHHCGHIGQGPCRGGGPVTLASALIPALCTQLFSGGKFCVLPDLHRDPVDSDHIDRDQLSAGERTDGEADERAGPQDRRALRPEYDWRGAGLPGSRFSSHPLAGQPMGSGPADRDEPPALCRDRCHAPRAFKDRQPLAPGRHDRGFRPGGVPALHAALHGAGAYCVRRRPDIGTEGDQGGDVCGAGISRQGGRDISATGGEFEKLCQQPSRRQAVYGGDGALPHSSAQRTGRNRCGHLHRNRHHGRRRRHPYRSCVHRRGRSSTVGVPVCPAFRADQQPLLSKSQSASDRRGRPPFPAGDEGSRFDVITLEPPPPHDRRRHRQSTPEEFYALWQKNGRCVRARFWRNGRRWT